jgi:3-oxoadipate enol-lactonase
MPTVTLDNKGKIEIYYEEEGRGIPLVMIGGLTATVEVWGELRKLLAAKNRLIMPDNRGSGRTRVPQDDEDRTPQRLAGDVRALTDGLKLERFHLMGGSFGGTIVQEFALAHPERLRSLIIACSHFGGKDRVKPPAGLREIRVRGAAPNATEQERQAALETLFHPETIRLRPEVVRKYDEDKRRFPHSKEELARRDKGIATFDTSERLRHLKVPTLVIHGSQDVLVPTENASLLAKRIPGAELVIIQGAGHHFYSEQPASSARAILDFLSKH